MTNNNGDLRAVFEEKARAGDSNFALALAVMNLVEVQREVLADLLKEATRIGNAIERVGDMVA